MKQSVGVTWRDRSRRRWYSDSLLYDCHVDCVHRCISLLPYDSGTVVLRDAQLPCVEALETGHVLQRAPTSFDERRGKRRRDSSICKGCAAGCRRNTMRENVCIRQIRVRADRARGETARDGGRARRTQVAPRGRCCWRLWCLGGRDGRDGDRGGRTGPWG